MGRQSNKDKAQASYLDFCLWRDGKTLEQLVPYLSRRKNGDVVENKLNRSKISKELGIGSAITQNPDINDAMLLLDREMLAAGLRQADVSVPAALAVPGTVSSTAMSPVHGGLSAVERRRINELEEENAYLREELKVKDAALKRYCLIDRFLADTMRLPR